ncbi:MAG: DoxX family membrane protein [Bacteroidetes bacterium]|nr:DoxX family membrane protein [Bacteroidota bacterium]
MKSVSYSNTQITILVILRWLIGWHLLYEGLVKLWNPGWSSGGFLMDSQGLFAGFFHNLAANPSVLKVVDLLNVWGLVLIGLALILGVFTRFATICGIILLSFYFLSHPPLVTSEYAMPSEGSYLFVNKNLIEIFALAVLLVFPSGKIVGLDRLIAKMFNRN